jgi:argininosuccinate lyase
MKNLHDIRQETAEFLKRQNKRFDPAQRRINGPATGTGGRAGNVQPIDSENMKRIPLIRGN